MTTSFVINANEEDLFGVEEIQQAKKTKRGKKLRKRPKHSNKMSPTVFWNSSVDFRFVQSGSDKSWTAGGRGFSRYGAATDNKPTQGFKIPQLTLSAGLYANRKVSGHIQVNFSDHDDSGKDNQGLLGLVEGHLDLKNRTRLMEINARAGFLIPPISLEHPESGWNTRYSITPSAINTWVGEEVRALGLETTINLRKLKNTKLTMAAFSGNDPLGAILSWRGWALHDYQATYGSRLKIQSVPDVLFGNNSSNTWTGPFKEIDNRIGIYTKLSQQFTKGHLSAFYYNNFGDDSEISGAEYAWKTDFYNISFKYIPTHWLEILGQYMAGATGMGGQRKSVDNDFTAWYLLSSFILKKHRLTFRYDQFEVVDNDSWTGPSSETDLNDSSGTSYMISYFLEMRPKTHLGLEYLAIDAERVGNEGYAKDDAKDNQLQLMLRLTL